MQWHFLKVKGIYLPNTVLLFGKKQSEWKMCLLKCRLPKVSVMDFNCQWERQTDPKNTGESDKAEAVKRWTVIQHEPPLLPGTRESKNLPPPFSLHCHILCWTLCNNHPCIFLYLCSAPSFFSLCQPSSIEVLNNSLPSGDSPLPTK